jgi:hypothetical protein
MLVLTLLVGCSGNKVNRPETEKLSEKTELDTVTPINYLDFEYSKVIAFATVDPFDYSELYFSSTLDLSKFHDTISKLLNSEQVNYLNDLLSGRHRKPISNAETVQIGADCFYPRHNIIFLDEKDSIIHFISVCFECGNSKQSKSDLADMDNMQSFFDSVGLAVFDSPDYHVEFYNSLNKLKKKNP